MARQQCPKGTICFSWSMAAVLVILGVFLFIIMRPIMPHSYTNLLKQSHHSQQHMNMQPQMPEYPPTRPTNITVIAKGGDPLGRYADRDYLPTIPGWKDDRYTRAPEPIRRPAFGQLPSIATRGGYAEYQQLGVLERKDGSFYPLFGRRTFNSDKFNYYTRTDTYNPVQLPLSFNKRDCTDDNGCNEISSGDDVRIGGNEEAKVKLYTSSIMQ
jgi:hypothetical protein